MDMIARFSILMTADPVFLLQKRRRTRCLVEWLSKFFKLNYNKTIEIYIDFYANLAMNC